MPGAVWLDGSSPYVQAVAGRMSGAEWVWMADGLDSYRRKRDLDATPEPAPGAESGGDGAPRFVIQQHHARRLHWDLRLEHDGTLASWALPRGVPVHPDENRLAVRTEDHPLEYLEFHGEIPRGNYGAGKMEIWDAGTYEPEKFRENEVIAVLHGERVSGRYALFHTRGKDWMIHRMDPPADAALEPMPDAIEPMFATAGKLPRDDAAFGYEVKWDGVRAVGHVDAGRLRLVGRNGTDFTPRYPELRAFAEEQGARRMIVDGEVVAFDERGLPSFERLQRRMHLASDSAVRRLMGEVPVTYVIFDLLWLEGHAATALPYRDRRRLLAGLELEGARVAHARASRGRRRRAARGGAGAGAGGDRRQAARQPLRAGPALECVDQGQERRDPGRGDRRVDTGRGREVEHARRAVRRRLRRRRRAALLRQGRHRLHRGDAAPGAGRPEAARARQHAVHRPPAAEGHAVHSAAPRRAGGVPRVDTCGNAARTSRSRACGTTSSPRPS